MTIEFTPPSTWVWDTDLQVFKDLVGSTKSGIPYAYNEDGDKLVGFANPYYDAAYRNKSGRPKERNTSALALAQDRIDGFANTGVARLRKIAENKWEELGLEGQVPLKLQIEVSKYLLDKAIANEKEKNKAEQVENKIKEVAIATELETDFESAVIVEFEPISN